MPKNGRMENFFHQNTIKFNSYSLYCTQFEIVGLDRYVEDNPHYGHRFTICGKETYARILVKKLS